MMQQLSTPATVLTTGRVFWWRGIGTDILQLTFKIGQWMDVLGYNSISATGTRPRPTLYFNNALRH